MDGENNSNNNGSNDAAEQDRLKNLQAEFSRKTSNLDSKLEAINQQLQQLSLLGQVNTKQQETQTAAGRPDPILEPEAYEKYMEQKLESKLNSRLEVQQRQQAEIGSLVAQFPELQDPNSDLTKSALQIYNSMSPSDKSNPIAYRTAIQQAALDLGVLPKAKRQQQQQVTNDESDDIGNGNKRQQQQSTKSSKNGKLDAATLAFAQALGKDINDPKYRERLEKAASRGTWGKFKSQKDY